MVFLYILGFIVIIALFIAIGFVCGRVCSELIRKTNLALNEVMWFWLGFIFQAFAVLMCVLLIFATRKKE